MNPPSDFELAQAVSHGAVSYIGDLYERHGRRVFSLCLRMTGDVSEAEDLTQDVFIQLIRKVGTFRGESQFRTWLYRFTINQVLMSFRRPVHRREISGMLEELTTTRVVKHAWSNQAVKDRKSTRLNSSHLVISYAVFCLKKKKQHKINNKRKDYDL